MRDFSDYYAYKPNDKRRFSAEQTFDRMYHQGCGYEITLNGDKGKKKKVIIIKHTVQMSQAQEERKLYIKNKDMNKDFFQGDVISGYSENADLSEMKYMVMTTPSSDGLYSSFCKIRRINSELSFVVEDGTVYTEPCILTDQTLYTDGVYQDSFAKYSDDKRGMIIRCTEGTSKLRLNQRVMFNKNSIYYIAKIDDYTLRQKYDDGETRGIYQCVLTRAEGIDLALDNFELGVADYYKYHKRPIDGEGADKNYAKTLNVQPMVSEIIGSDIIRNGRSEIYTIHRDASWGASNPNIEISKVEDGVKVTCKRDAKLIGESFTLTCYVNSLTYRKQISIGV